MTYLTCCVNSTYELITALNDTAKPIGRKTFLRSVDRASLRELESALSYDTGLERGGLRMSNDWHVGYYRGVYDSKPCVFFRHSAIEYIFV